VPVAVTVIDHFDVMLRGNQPTFFTKAKIVFHQIISDSFYQMGSVKERNNFLSFIDKPWLLWCNL
jgi:hypothetical protein